MKKSSIIAIFLIYLTSIILVGFFGFKMKADNPIIYANKIVWNSSEFENKTGFTIVKDKEVLEEKGFLVDASLNYKTYDLAGGMTINIKCNCEPLEATNPKLEYSLDTQSTKIELNVLSDNTANLTFKASIGANLTVRTTDGSNIKYIIKIDVINISEFI